MQTVLVQNRTRCAVSVDNVIISYSHTCNVSDGTTYGSSIFRANEKIVLFKMLAARTTKRTMRLRVDFLWARKIGENKKKRVPLREKLQVHWIRYFCARVHRSYGVPPETRTHESESGRLIHHVFANVTHTHPSTMSIVCPVDGCRRHSPRRADNDDNVDVGFGQHTICTKRTSIQTQSGTHRTAALS